MFTSVEREADRQAPILLTEASNQAAEKGPEVQSQKWQPPISPAVDSSIDYIDLKVRIHQKLLDVINLSALDKMESDEIHREIGPIIAELLQADGSAPMNQEKKKQIVFDIVDELVGLGPIEALVKDSTISDIMVNSYSKVFIERNGRVEKTGIRFKDERHLLRIIDKIVSSVGRRVDESQPMVDARLKDGSRVNAIVRPLAVDGPILSIRKFGTVRPTIGALVANGTMTQEMADLLKAVIGGKLNVLISGGTGSGKTTLLNAVSSFIGETERIVTIEDAAELQLQQEHVLRLETRPKNIEGEGEITQRDLLKNALRMRPDRIIVGEVRGGEAFDMLQAMNTGHDGSLTTIHANSCRDSLARLEQMIAMAGFDFPLRSLRAQISSAIDVVIQVARMSDGRRYLTSLHELTGMEGDVVTMQEIFRFKRTGLDENHNVLGHFEATGIRPKFMEQLENMGIHVSPEIFSPNRDTE